MSSVDVVPLPADAPGTSRTVDDMSTSELSIPKGQAVAAVLPVITVSEQAVYVFGLSLSASNVSVGKKIYVYAYNAEETGAVAATFRSSASSSGACVILDDDGSEIDTLPANKHINIASYMEAGSYSLIIAADASTITRRNSGHSTDDYDDDDYTYVPETTTDTIPVTPYETTAPVIPVTPVITYEKRPDSNETTPLPSDITLSADIATPTGRTRIIFCTSTAYVQSGDDTNRNVPEEGNVFSLTKKVNTFWNLTAE